MAHGAGQEGPEHGDGVERPPETLVQVERDGEEHRGDPALGIGVEGVVGGRRLGRTAPHGRVPAIDGTDGRADHAVVAEGDRGDVVERAEEEDPLGGVPTERVAILEPGHQYQFTASECAQAAQGVPYLPEM